MCRFKSCPDHKRSDVKCKDVSGSANTIYSKTHQSSVSICSGEALVGFQRGDVSQNVRKNLKGAGATPVRYAQLCNSDWLEYLADNEEVAGSSPAATTLMLGMLFTSFGQEGLRTP